MVSVLFIVKYTLFFDNLTLNKINKIRLVYGDKICADDSFWTCKRESKYATLIFIDNPVLIEPFKAFKHNRFAFKSCIDVKRI